MVNSTFVHEILFSYLILTGFITVFIALTGQSFFGSVFPANPITTTTFNFVSTCSNGGSLTDILCSLGFYGGIIATIISIPFSLLGYVFAIFIFFLTSSTSWWIGAVIFVPPAIIILFYILELLIAIIGALIP